MSKRMRRFGDLTGETPQEMHARLAWRGHKCTMCGAPPVIRIKVLTPVSEMNPGVLAAIAASNTSEPGKLPVIPTKYGDVMLTADVFACRGCRKAAETAAAKGPSFNIIEIDRGPDPSNKVTVGYA